MDSSPPQTDGKWPTPSKRTSRVLSRHAHMSARKIAAATGVPKSTVQDHLKAPTSRTCAKSQRGRKHKIDDDTIEKMIFSLQGHYNEHIKPWQILRSDWNLNCTDQTLASAFAQQRFHECKACQNGIMSPLNLIRR